MKVALRFKLLTLFTQLTLITLLKPLKLLTDSFYRSHCLLLWALLQPCLKFPAIVFYRNDLAKEKSLDSKFSFFHLK